MSMHRKDHQVGEYVEEKWKYSTELNSTTVITVVLEGIPGCTRDVCVCVHTCTQDASLHTYMYAR
jgi:hypothetical protein